jgi:hypothetical protein
MAFPVPSWLLYFLLAECQPDSSDGRGACGRSGDARTAECYFEPLQGAYEGARAHAGHWLSYYVDLAVLIRGVLY